VTGEQYAQRMIDEGANLYPRLARSRRIQQAWLSDVKDAAALKDLSEATLCQAHADRWGAVASHLETHLQNHPVTVTCQMCGASYNGTGLAHECPACAVGLEPCIYCNRTDLPLHTDGKCTECHQQPI
jgi:hypothetical protein